METDSELVNADLAQLVMRRLEQQDAAIDQLRAEIGQLETRLARFCELMGGVSRAVADGADRMLSS